MFLLVLNQCISQGDVARGAVCMCLSVHTIISVYLLSHCYVLLLPSLTNTENSGAGDKRRAQQNNGCEGERRKGEEKVSVSNYYSETSWLIDKRNAAKC